MLAWLVDDLALSVGFGVFAVVGGLIVSRRRDNTVGWLMLIGAAVFAAGWLMRPFARIEIGGSPVDPPTVALVADAVGPGLLFLGYFMGLVFLPLVYPDGRLPSRRWRPLMWLAGVFVALATGVAPLYNLFGDPRVSDSIPLPGRGRVEFFDIANPLKSPVFDIMSTIRLADAVVQLVIVSMIVAVVLAGIVRFRRSEGIERQQMKWFVYAGSLVVASVGGD